MSALSFDKLQVIDSAGCGTVVLPIVGTVSVGAVCAVAGFVGGAIYGGSKSILTQITN